MLRKLAFALFVVGLALLSGCGGGGGGGGGGSNVHVEPGQYIEFLQGSGGWFDPFNLKVGDSGTAVLANYDGLGNRSELVAGNWTTTSGGAVSINSVSGAFGVNSTSVEFKFQTTSTILGVPTLFEQRGRVPTAVPSLSGRVVEINTFSGLPSNTGVPHLDVDFFDAGGTIVGSARTMQDGRFKAFLPTTATQAMVSGNTIKTSRYYKAVYYQTKYYSPLDTTCRIALSALGGGSNSLPAPMALPTTSSGPPPPPTGCS